MTKRIFHSRVLRNELDRICKEKGIHPLGVVRSVPTRWNSVALVIKRALHLRLALDILAGLSAFNTSRGPRLLRFKLDMEEWTLLEQLQPLLDVRLMNFTRGIAH